MVSNLICSISSTFFRTFETKRERLTHSDSEFAFCNQGNMGRPKEPTIANLITVQDNTETNSNLDNTIFGYRNNKGTALCLKKNRRHFSHAYAWYKVKCLELACITCHSHHNFKITTSRVPVFVSSGPISEEWLNLSNHTDVHFERKLKIDLLQS